MNNLQEIKFDDFQQHLGKYIIIKTEKGEEQVKLISVTDSSFSVKIKRNDMWDGIEPHYAKPTTNYIKFYLV